MRTPDRPDETLAATVSDALAGIAEPGRQVLYLRFYEDCSLAEIAHRLDISLSAAKMRLYRGLEQLRDWYRRERDTALKPGKSRANCQAARSLGATVGQNTSDAGSVSLIHHGLPR